MLKHICQFLLGDAALVTATLEPQSIDTVVTSPPYYRQRDYAADDQIGNESTPRAYVDRLVEVFRALRPAIKSTGSLWIVLGDKYVDGQLLGMPWRVALAMQDDGWLLRADCIWHKPNAMPSSIANRPTVDHEYLFLVAKTADYYYNADAIREPHVTFSERSRMKGGRRHFGLRGGTPEQGKNSGRSNLHDARWDQAFHPLGRNKRTVWSIPLSKFRGAHFAVFPEKLVETCLLATCPPGGTVLDPFAGAGTTALVAERLGRHSISVDCNAEYLEMAKRRVLAARSEHSIMNASAQQAASLQKSGQR